MSGWLVSAVLRILVAPNHPSVLGVFFREEFKLLAGNLRAGQCWFPLFSWYRARSLQKKDDGHIGSPQMPTWTRSLGFLWGTPPIRGSMSLFETNGHGGT